MYINITTLFVAVNLFAVLLLATLPFIFFNVYAENSNSIWKVTIMEGASDQNPSQIFYPDELPVRVGDKIVLENVDKLTHSITSGLPDYPEHAGIFFSTGEIKPGNSASFILTNTEFNAFYYFCEIHPWMTGKIFTSDSPSAQPETEHPIETEKQSYSYGETIIISGQVHNDFAKTAYKILIFDQKNKLVDLTYGYFYPDATYLQTKVAKGDAWNTDGEYLIRLVYALPSKVAQTNFEFSNNMISESVISSMPIWIKNVGKFWCNDQIEDSEFVGAIEYLIKENIIILDESPSHLKESKYMPIWVKNNACWWADGKIPDIDFISGIEFLVNIGTIRV